MILLKKIFGAALVVAAAMSIIACGSKTKTEGQTGENESAVITDAICMEAKGPIEEMNVSSKSGIFGSDFIYKFDENGEITSIQDGFQVDYGKDDIKMERDDKNRPVKMTISYTEMGEDEPTENVTVFSYDGNGNLVKEEHQSGGDSWTVTYTLDQNGNAIEYTVSDQEGEAKYAISYPDGAIDNEGNWTARTVTSNGETTTVTRKITYRK